MKKKVGLALSGGVDSALAAHLLLEQGYEVEAWHMLLPEFRDGELRVNPDRQADARRVAELLKIPFHTIDLTETFKREVLEPFRAAYCSGKTPNPCALCNPAIKFGALFDAMRANGCELIATGHYARIENGFLAPAADAQKDQSYFLYRLPKYQLDCILFPIGGLLRSEVRELAEKAGLPVSQKKSSQDICFLPEGDYRPLLPDYVLAPGPVVDTSGKQIGTHQGFASCTIGQRKGIGIATGERAYVVEIRPERYTVVVGSREDLLKKSFLVRDVNWMLDHPRFPLRAEARTRYHKPLFPVTITAKTNGDDYLVEADTPQEAIAPGQACVFYRDGLLIGGGTIARGNEIKILYGLFAPVRNQKKYIKQHRLDQVTDLISLDTLVCRSLIDPLCGALHYMHYAYCSAIGSKVTTFYTSCECVLRSAAGHKQFHFIALVIDPGQECREFIVKGFDFLGYELLEGRLFDYSIITSLSSDDPAEPSPFPLAFDTRELNCYGLIDDYARAVEIRDALETHYPEELDRTQSVIFAVWRHQTLGRVLPPRDLTDPASFLYLATAPHDDLAGYRDWRGAPQITELLSLDDNLCDDLVAPNYSDDEEAWRYVYTNGGYMTDFFTSAEFVLSRIKGTPRFNFFAVVVNPGRECRDAEPPEGFEFVGYELLDIGGFSAINDCGAYFDPVFTAAELNQFGLLDTYARAREIQQRILVTFPDCHHADTNLFAVWRHRTLGRG